MEPLANVYSKLPQLQDLQIVIDADSFPLTLSEIHSHFADSLDKYLDGLLKKNMVFDCRLDENALSLVRIALFIVTGAKSEVSGVDIETATYLADRTVSVLCAITLIRYTEAAIATVCAYTRVDAKDGQYYALWVEIDDMWHDFIDGAARAVKGSVSCLCTRSMTRLTHDPCLPPVFLA